MLGRESHARRRTPARDERKSRQVSPKKERVAFYLSEDLADAIRNAVGISLGRRCGSR